MLYEKCKHPIWERSFSRISWLKTPQPIETKFGASDGHPNICWGNKSHRDRLRGFICPILWWSCDFCVSPFILLISWTARTRRPIWSVDGPNDTVWFKERFFWGVALYYQISFWGPKSWNPQILPRMPIFNSNKKRISSWLETDEKCQQYHPNKMGSKNWSEIVVLV